ncbi:MAG TPA: DciA family protein [Gammaproteobacteria bacterium]|nr:DciA family protein [Gammaproteobacteria bacterium]
MPNGSPTVLAKILRSGASRLWEQAQRRQRLTRLLQEQLPEVLHPHCQVAHLSAESVVLATDSPVWAARLRYYSPQILKHLGQRETVNPRTLRIRIVPPAEPPRTGPPARPPLSRQNSRLLRQAADAIDHPQLQEALRRLATRGER